MNGNSDTTKSAVWPPLLGRDAWISWPSLPDPRAAVLTSLLAQLEQSQWYAPEQLVELQGRQLAKLLEYAAHHSPFYRKRLAGGGGVDAFRNIPLLSRAELQQQYAHINCTSIPREHGSYSETKSSGSTGQMVAVRRSEACMMFWLALTLREHLWHKRDFTGAMAIIRPTVAENDKERQGVALPDWGPPVSLLFQSGKAYALNLQTDVARQAEWLAGIDPEYLLTFPTNLAALVQHFNAHGNPLRHLKAVRTVGETLTDELRRQCQAFFEVEIADTFSSQELGVIALQCPESGMYHVMSENLMVEILHEDGRACAQGETGRVVVTDLHNFATPLIRYDTRDYAEVGPTCSCGRGLPTLARIKGRSRNMIRLPDGRRFWPLVGAYHFREVAPVSQYQVIQHALTQLEVRLVSERAVTPAEESKLTDAIHRSLGYPFDLQFRYFETEIPRGTSGKFEEFICLLDEAA